MANLNETYWQFNYVRVLYKNIKKSSHENATDEILNVILHHYFRVEEGFGVSQQVSPYTSDNPQKSDLIVKYLPLDIAYKVVIVESKRAEFEGRASEWASAAEQLTDYMKLVRAEVTSTLGVDVPLYGIIAVGRYCRFYELRPRLPVLEDFPGTGGNYFDFKKDALHIDAALRSIKANILSYVGLQGQQVHHSGPGMYGAQNASAQPGISQPPFGGAGLYYEEPIGPGWTQAEVTGSNPAYSLAQSTYWGPNAYQQPGPSQLGGLDALYYPQHALSQPGPADISYYGLAPDVTGVMPPAPLQQEYAHAESSQQADTALPTSQTRSNRRDRKGKSRRH